MWWSASQLKGPRFESTCQLGPFFVELACSPRGLPLCENMHVTLTVNSKLVVGVSSCSLTLSQLE